MTRWPLTRKDTVSHVGTLEYSDRQSGRKPSLEAFCLSVSDHPEDWRSIACLGDAPQWALSRHNSFFIDVMAFSDDQNDLVRDWAITSGYARQEQLWKAWFTNESDEWCYMLLKSREAAQMEVEDYDVPEGEGPAPDGSCVEPVEDLVLTEAGEERLDRWRNDIQGFDGALILFCREVIRKENPDIVGIWWDETYDPDMFSCPRGGLFPECLPEFEKHLEHRPDVSPGF